VGFYAECPKISHAKKAPVERESPRVEKPPSPSAGKSTSEASKPVGPKENEDPAGAKDVPTSPSNASLGRDIAHPFLGPEPSEHPEASPQSPKSFGLRAPSGCQPSEGSYVPGSGK
jgi:hypothetical protein